MKVPFSEDVIESIIEYKPAHWTTSKKPSDFNGGDDKQFYQAENYDEKHKSIIFLFEMANKKKMAVQYALNEEGSVESKVYYEEDFNNSLKEDYKKIREVLGI